MLEYEEDVRVEQDHVDPAPVCYYCAYYFGPALMGYCRKYEICVSTSKTCIYFEPNRNDW